MFSLEFEKELSIMSSSAYTIDWANHKLGLNWESNAAEKTMLYLAGDMFDPKED